jgi:heme-degrading monooxygenase HmoA
MIARVWHGRTKPENADAYETMLKPELLPGVGKVKGFHHSYLLRRSVGAEVEFITVMFWDSIESIKAFSGPDYETSIIPEKRKPYLSYHDPKAMHYEVVSVHEAGRP